ncbi:hypothetical protein GLAREA_02457 [Glarea lozoyensis ATCC 20868]|uniref:Uncharacterized protein n=1 Tax=Glarea lozoyensis (strain ATCC 20868 / MF5171) TaxID=1116229 RepID=S3CMV4_GLAL2|nr:uncharacterized protein GLAREA_02457 [Glarea lozoyensis ATCC 20868]EPE26544.1 hypothetical protein GLAREA_02457 [Glarea lozoyensis ATCC 20868]
MLEPRYTLIIVIDPGTSSMTASYAIVRDIFDNLGNRVRYQINEPTALDEWPDSPIGVNPGHVCVPCVQIYSKATKRQLHWGFGAEEYLKDTNSGDDFDDVLVVEHIKSLLKDLREVHDVDKVSHLPHLVQAKKILEDVLEKKAIDVFKDLLTEVISHILGSAVLEYTPWGYFSQPINVEVGFCLPSEWSEALHSSVAHAVSKSSETSLARNNINVQTFGIEDVLTISDTLSGVRQFLRQTVFYETGPTDPRRAEIKQSLNENASETEINDVFSAFDVGAETACITVLRLIATSPVRVDQLGPTLSLPFSGDAVDNHFRTLLEKRITSTDFPGNIHWAIEKIVRRVEEKKQWVGRHATNDKLSRERVTGLRANPEKGFKKHVIEVDWIELERCFDPIIHQLEQQILATVVDYPQLKAVVFLGQFGGNSRYLQERLKKGLLTMNTPSNFSTAGAGSGM